MSHIPFHPAPGLGDLMPGFFVVPNNPITAAMGGPGSLGGVSRVPHIGELMPAAFVVPQNPLIDALATVGRGQADAGLTGCGCNSLGDCGCRDRVALSGGLGAFDLSQFTSQLQDVDWVKWGLIGGGVLLVMLMFSRPGKSAYKAGMEQARSDYQAKVSGLKKKYGRVYQRLGRATSAAASAL